MSGSTKVTHVGGTLFAGFIAFSHVAAKTEVRLWCMERQTYRTIMTNKSKKKREQLMGFLKTYVYRRSYGTASLSI